MYKFIVVDDELIVTETFEYLLDWNEIGYEFSGAFTHASDALSFLRKNHDISLVITDINMADMSGIEFADIIKKEFPGIGIIIISGYENFTYAKEAIRLQVLSYIVKPIDIDELSISLQTAKQQLTEYTPTNQTTQTAIIAHTKQYVKEHISDKLTTEIIAQAIHISPTYLRTLFHQHTKETLFDYITREKLSFAARLLTTTHLTISEIRYKVGYSSPKYFLKIFKKYYSVTPSEYRNKVNQQK